MFLTVTPDVEERARCLSLRIVALSRAGAEDLNARLGSEL